MATYREAVDGFIKNAACSVLNTLDGATQLIQRKVVGDVLEDISFPAFLNRRLCGQEPPTIPPPPFNGGQCNCVPYNVDISVEIRRRDDNSLVDTRLTTLQTTGPITSIAIEDPSPSGPDSVSVALRGSFSNCQPGAVSLTSAARELFRMDNLQILSITRGDGLPDNCGSPPSVVPPPAPGFNVREGDITYVNSEGNNITVPIVAAFGYADIDINGSLSIPIKVDVGGIKVDVNFNLNTGDIQFFPTNNYPSRKPGGQPTDYLPSPGIELPDYPPNLPLPLPPIDEEDKDTEPIIVAVVVTTESVETGRISTLFQDDNPSIRIPSLGHVSFLCRVGFMESAWTSDIPVKNERQLIPCPWEGGAIRVAGTPQPGVEWTLTPIYSRKNSPILFPEGEPA